MIDLVTTISDERLAEIDELVSKLNHLVSLDRPENGGPYQGLAARECLAAMQQASDAIQSLRAQGGVRVKPLEWREEKVSDRFSRLVAETQLGTYEAMQWSSGEFGGSMPSMNRADNNRDFSGLHNLEAAKAAAQADYERRILSSLEASPAPVSEEIIAQVMKLEEACNSARTALAGMTSPETAIYLLDCRPLGVSAALASKGGQ